MELNNICPICLRNDRMLKDIPTALSEYHDKITDFTLPFKNYCYCSVCECLLRKTYNFQQKCTNSAKILQNWVNVTTTNKTPANVLHLKLPPISLGKWTAKNNKVFDFTYEYRLEEPIVIDDCIEVDPQIDTIMDLNMLENRNDNEKKDGHTNNKSQPGKMFKIEFPHEQHQSTGVSNTSFLNFNNAQKLFIVGSEDTINIVTNELLHKNSDNTIMNTEIAGISNIEDNTTTKIKNELVPILADDMLKLNDVARLTNIPKNKTFINNTDDKDLELMHIDDDGNKNDIILLDDENVYPDDASLNSNDDCDDYLHLPPIKTIKKKMTLDELANINLSDEDLDEDYESNIKKTTDGSGKEDISMTKCISTEKSIISKLESMNKTLDSICENWEVTSLMIDMDLAEIQRKDEIKKTTHNFLKQRKTLFPKNEHTNSVIITIGHIDTDLDFIIERCSNTIDLGDPKERFKTMLKNWNTLISEDCVVLDKDIIIDRVDSVKVGAIRRLLKLMRGKKRLGPEAVQILTNIQNGGDLCNKYKSVFDIEYLSTAKERLEEFERRKTYDCYVKAEFKCDICYQPFKRKMFLENHKKQYHDENRGQYSCVICHVRHDQKKAMRAHINSHNAVYKCKLCPLVTYYRGSMENHYEQHKGTIYECDKCFNTYKSRSMLASHKCICHSSHDYVCTICGGSYYSKNGLKIHMVKKHQNDSSELVAGTGISCEKCTFIFSSKEAYTRHWRKAHRPRNGTIRQKHEYQKTVCLVCNVSKSGAWLKHHYKNMHPDVDFKSQYEMKKEFLCDICGAVYNTEVSLRAHIDKHAGVRAYACELCPKRFHTAQHLSNHRLYHFPPALVCQLCGKKFHTKSNLYNHVKGHERTVRSHKCQYCQKGFFNIYMLNEHVRGVHYNVRRIRKRVRQETDATGAAGKRSVRVKAGAKRVKKIASTDESSTDESSSEECSN